MFPPTSTKWVITRETAISVPTISIVAENGNNIISEGSKSIVSEVTIPVSFDYFVREQDTSYDTVSLRGSNDNVLRQLFRM